MNPLTLVKRIQNINSREADLGISEEASWHAKYKDSAYVFVGGIPFDLTEGDLLAVFAQYGEIVDVNLVRDKGTGKSKGFAFVAYEDQRSTNLAVDNLNGAQILGRIIRVDHVTKYKKKEEEDEETQQQKREARGVCRAFQRGECTRGAACKFSHDEQRAANTGWGPDDRSSRWAHDHFEGPKQTEKGTGNERPSESHPRESDRREEKRSRRHGADEIERASREDYDRRQERRVRRHSDDFLEPKSREDHYKSETRLRRNEGDEYQPKLKDHYKRDDIRFRSNKDDAFVPKLREDSKRDEKRLRRDDNDKSELTSREDDRREERGWREDQDNRGGNKPSAHHRVSSSHHRRDR